MKTEALFEADGAKHAGRILDERQVVQHPDDTLLDILLAAEMIG
jgi:hypothetical protein